MKKLALALAALATLGMTSPAFAATHHHKGKAHAAKHATKHTGKKHAAKAVPVEAQSQAGQMESLPVTGQ
jgi:hypothetical protein